MNHLHYAVLLACIAIMGCTDDGTPEEIVILGPLRQVNEYFDGRLATSYELFYNDDLRMDSVHMTWDVSMSTAVKIRYDNEQVARLSFTLLRNGFTILYDYDVLHFDNETIVLDRQTNRTIVFKSTEGYVDSYKVFITTHPQFMTEGFFVRDADQNIESMSFYESNEMATDYFIFEYTFAEWDIESDIPEVFNPTFDRSFYDYSLLFYLGLKLSNGTPLVSSYRDGNGTMINNNIRSEISDRGNGVVKRISQTRQDIPDVLTEIEFIY